MITLNVTQSSVDVVKDNEVVKSFPLKNWECQVDSLAYSDAVFYIRHNFFAHADFIDLSRITKYNMSKR